MKILLAVSGGVDSMYLANRAREIFPGSCFAVAHCNFHLRGRESDEDETFVREWCTKNGMPLFVNDFDTRAYAASHGISIEMAARELRYGWFANLCKEEGFDAVAVAHNANDNAETLMLNLLRGTGSKGLRGMSQNSAGILRPLLGISRSEIENWMKARGLSWREDSSNKVNDAKRNVIRNEIFPVFSRINPSFVGTLNRDMEHFSQVDDIAEEYFSSSGLNMDEGVDLRELKSFKHWEYLLYRLLEPYNLSEETFGKLIALLKSDRTVSGKIFQSPTHIIRIRLKKILAEPRF